MCNCSRGRTNQPRNAQIRNTGQNEMVKVQLVEDSPVVFYGSYTGRAYRLNNMNQISWVDKRDAANLSGIKGLRVFS